MKYAGIERGSMNRVRTLVIGYGNELRGDDAVGPLVARTAESWQRPGLRALAVQQLTPELAEDIAGAYGGRAKRVQAARSALHAIVAAHPFVPADRHEHGEQSPAWDV